MINVKKADAIDVNQNATSSIDPPGCSGVIDDKSITINDDRIKIRIKPMK